MTLLNMTVSAALTSKIPERNHSTGFNFNINSNGTKSLLNETTPGPNDPLITLTVPAIMFASGVLGNILAIIVLARSSREHKQTVFYRLVGALACTDLFGTCATSPVTLAVYANSLKWVGGSPLCNYESFMLIFAGYATIFIVGAMAVDRLIAISQPYFYDLHVSPSKAIFVVLSILGFASFMGSLPILGLGENIIQFPGSWCFPTFTSPHLKNKVFVYSYATIALTIISLTAVANVYVTSILLKMRHRAVRTMNLRNTKRHDSELQMMVLLLGIIVIFSTCWCPFMIRLLINQSNESQLDVSADLSALRLASLNQILDPWIYILFRKEMFLRLFRFLKRLCANERFPSCVGMTRDSEPQCGAPTGSLVNNEVNDGDLEVDLGDYSEVINGGKTKHLDINGDIPKIEEPNTGGDNTVELVPLHMPQDHDTKHTDHNHSSCLFCFSKQHSNLLTSLLADNTNKMEMIRSSSSKDMFKDSEGSRKAMLNAARTIHASLGDISC